MCAACSPLTALHPESNNSERICIACYSFYLEKSISETREKEYQEKLDSELVKVKRESMEFQHFEAERLKEQNKLQEKALREQINRLSLELEQKDTRIMSMTLTAETPKEAIKEDTKNDDSLTELINKIKTLEIENEELKKKKPVYVAEQRSGSCLKSCTIQ